MPLNILELVYKIISNVIEIRLKNVISLGSISKGKFSFLNNTQFHKYISISQEGIHFIKVRDMSYFIINMDLSKEYDKDTWDFIRFILLHVGCKIEFVNWIEGCFSLFLSHS